MGEFKIGKGLEGEISSLRNSGDFINNGYTTITSDDVSTLKTCASIISQHESIKCLLDLYKSLILRDAQDLDDLLNEANEMDTTISASYDT